MTLRHSLLAALVLSAGGFVVVSAEAADSDRKPVKELASFGVLQSPTSEEAKIQASKWLESVGKTDANSKVAFEAIWKADRTLLDKVTDTLILGDANAAKLIGDARDLSSPAPTETPSILKDGKLPPFFRSNLALAYAKSLAQRRVYEEVLEALKVVKPENVVDPATYFFHKAVAEHTLMLKKEADETISRLLDDVVDAPERYRMVAALMHLDMLTWQDKDLGWIARKMSVIKDRLELTRGGKKTQQMQKEVLVRLDEMIKQMENQQKNQGQGQGSNGGACPPGAQPQDGPPGNNTQSSSPQQDSNGGNGGGRGVVDPKRLKDLVENWGTAKDKDRIKIMQEISQEMPAKYREAIEIYMKQMRERSAGGSAGENK